MDSNVTRNTDKLPIPMTVPQCFECGLSVQAAMKETGFSERTIGRWYGLLQQEEARGEHRKLCPDVYHLESTWTIQRVKTIEKELWDEIERMKKEPPQAPNKLKYLSFIYVHCSAVY